MKKKVLSMLVTFAMLLSMFPATAFAADFNVTADGNDLDGADSADFYTFDEVLSQATAGDQIIIKENVTADEAFTVTDVTIDLGGNKLTVGAGGNYFKGNVVVKNGTIDIADVTASGDCIMGIGDRNADATLTLEDVNLTGSDYSSAFAVLMVYGDGTLNVKGGEWNLSDDQSTAGGVIKNENGAGDSGNVNISGTTMKFSDVERGIAGATVVLDEVDLTITGGDNGINGSKLTVKNSDITITGGTGRALTVTDYDVSVEKSTLNLSGNGEADIRFKTNNTLTVDADSTLSECTVIADGSATTAKVNSSVVTGTESDPQSVAVAGGVTSIKTAPKGTVTPVYTEEAKFWGEGTANATASFVVELYEGSTKIATSSLINKDGIINGEVYVTWSIPFDGVDSDYWDVEWASGYPKYDMNPDAVKLVVDGTTVATNSVQFNAPDNLNKIVALAEGNTGGVKAYKSLTDAMGNFNGRKVNVLRDVTESIEEMNGCTLTTNVTGGVTITSTYDNYVYANDLGIGSGVTVKAGNFFYETDGENTVEGALEVADVFYHGYNAKTTVQNGGSIKVSGSTILRYNENEASGLYIYGDDDESTVEFDCDYYIGAYSGTFYAEDANVECGYFLLKPSYDTEKEDADTKYPPMDVTLDNSTITVTGTSDGQNSFQIDDQAILTLKNGSAIKGVRDFNILIGAQPSISVDGTSSVSAENVTIADGVAMEATKNSDGTYTFAKKLSGEGTESDPYVISNLEDLKNFRDNVNNGNNYSNKFVELNADIDLAGETWTPIGTAKTPFNGNFNGNNCTISNLVVNGGSSDDQGFFGRTNNGTIKNLTIKNAKVSGYLNVGVVAGTPYTSKYTNITVTGHVEVNGMSYVGGVGGKNAYADWTWITVSVDDTSYVKATSTENGKAYRTYVGGVIGFIGEGNHTFKDIRSNIDVIGDVCDIGGIAGIAHYGNNFENIECTGDVTNNNNTADAAEDVLETGLIAGVWHNKANEEVSFKNITATGSISAPNVPGVEFTNDGLIGAAYTKTNDTQSTSGSLIIDGKKVWPLIAEVNGIQYGTLSEAIAAAGSEDVVTLLSDAAEAVEISDGGTTIDLGSNTLTGSFLIKNGDFEIKNGSVVNANADVSGIEVNNGSLVLTDVDVSSACHALRVDGNATVTVDGGEYKVSASTGKTTHAVNVSGTASVTIKGGTFTGPKGLANDSGAAVNVQTGSTVVITGGTFTGGKNNTLANAGTLTVVGGGFDQDPSAYLAAGYYSYLSPSSNLYYAKTDDGTVMVAEVNGVQYQTLDAALKAVKSGYTVKLLADITVDSAWDCRNNGAQVKVPVTIDGQGHTLKLTGNVDDKNWNTVFRFEDVATVQNLTIDASEATGIQRGISSKLSITVDNCTLIGNGTTAKRAVIYGEGAGNAISDVTATITNSEFKNWSYGVSDNQSGKDAKDVVITGNEFTNASVLVSAGQEVTFTGNTLDNGYVNISSYTTDTELKVTATGNILDSDFAEDNKIKADQIVAQDGFLTPASVAEVSGVKYSTLDDALDAVQADGTIELLADVTIADKSTVDKNLTIEGNGKTLTYTGSDRAIDVPNDAASKVNLTINDLTVDCTSSYCQRGINYNDDGELNLNGVTIKGTNLTYAVNLPGNSDNAKVDITNSNITGNIALNIWGENAQINVVNTTLTSVDKASHENYAAVKLNNNGTNSAEGTTVTVTGGSITALNENSEWSSAVTDATSTGSVTISDTTVVTGRIDVVVAVVLYEGQTEFYGYFTLADAFEKAKNDSKATVVLLRDIELTEAATVGGVVVLNLNGKSITGTIKLADGATLTAGEGLTVTTDVANKAVKYESGVYSLVTGYTVTFEVNGGSAVDAQKVVSGAQATKPADPTRSGYTFKGWYSDSGLTTAFDFTAAITADTTIYAKWSRNSSGGGGGGGSTSYTITVEDPKNGDITVSPKSASSGTTVTITVDPDNGYELDELAVLDKNGKEVELTKKSDTKYTFKMPSGKVTIEATFAEIEEYENPFVDVAEGAYYYDAVLWAAENGITGGTSATTFSPAVTCTRAQTVTFLWRAAGSPEPETTVCPFEDVTADKYYYDAVLWAVENGITVGTSATTFSPNATVTRAQNVTFLWRWAESPAVEAANPFADVASDMYYHDAVLWAAEEGITAGTTATTFSPNDPCLRSQIVTFLYRYLAE